MPVPVFAVVTIAWRIASISARVRRCRVGFMPLEV
jgi:hypothetical protein